MKTDRGLKFFRTATVKIAVEKTSRLQLCGRVLRNAARGFGNLGNVKGVGTQRKEMSVAGYLLLSYKTDFAHGQYYYTMHETSCTF